MLHTIERAVGSAQEFFRRIAIFRKCGNAGTDGQRGGLGFCGKTFANARNHASCNIRTRFRKHEGEFVAAITRGRIDSARVVAKYLREANDSAASGEMAVVIVNGFEAVHVEQDYAKRTLRAARAVQLRFENADK